jgi:hypothetical protein
MAKEVNIKKEIKDARQFGLEQIKLLYQKSQHTKNPIILIGLSKAMANLFDALN